MKKKILLIMLAIVSALCLAFGISACGKSKGDSAENGIYYRYESEQLDESDWYELKDGKWKDSGGEQGNYKLSGGEVSFYENVFGENINWATGTVKDGVLTISSLGITHTYCKEGSTPSTGGSQPGGTTPGGEQGDTPSVEEYEVTFILNYAGAGSVKKSTQNGLVTYVPERADYVFNGWWLSDGQTENGDYILAQKWDTSEKVTEEGLILVAEWVEESTVSAQLPAPSVSIDEDIFSWQEVPGAVSYDVRVYKSGFESEESRDTISDTSWTFPSYLEAGYYTVKIRAMGDGETTVNSAYVSKSYGHRILSVVSNISFDISTSILTWTAVRNATSYDLIIDGQEVETLTYTTYDLSDFEAGSHSVTIVAKRNGYQSSSASKSIEKKRLKTPKIKVTFDDDSLQYTVSWESVLHADTYIVTLNGEEHRVTDADSYTVDRASEDWGDNETIVVAVTAFDSNRDYLISNPSQEETIKRTYTVTLTVSDENAGTVSGGGNHAYDSQVTITASTKTGYNFLGWYDKDGELVSETARYTFKMGFDVSYTAKWDYYTLTTTRNNEQAGTLSKTYTDEKVSVGTKVTLKAITNKGYTFLGWYKGEEEVSTELSYQYTMTKENVSFEARWMKCPVTVSSGNYGGVVDKFPDTTVIGQEITLKATIDLGYIWEGWYQGEEQVTTDYTIQIIIGTETAAYEAKWSLDPAMEDFEFTSTPTTCAVNGVNDKTKEEFIIPNYVTEIKEGAFYGCGSIQSITIPFVGGSRKTSTDTYQYPFGYIFGTSQFSGATKTTQSYHGSSSFISTSNYYIPDSLKSVTITGGEILYGAFYSCSGLTSIEIPNSATSIGDCAFKDCSGLTSVVIPEGVTSIGRSAFDSCIQLKSVTIGSGVTSIESSAFSGCSGLTSIEIPDSVTSIGDSAFYGCDGLTSITIPDSVTSIGEYAFDGCSGLEKIEVAAGNPNYSSQDGILYNKEKTEFIHIPKAIKGAVTIPDGVTVIGGDAFYDCRRLTSITIPDSVTEIKEGAFYGCGSIQSITIPFVGGSRKTSTDTYRQYTFGHIFGTSQFSGATKTTQFYVDNRLYTTSTSYYIPDSLKSVTVTGGEIPYEIPYGAFSGCSGLTSIVILDSVTSIKAEAFSGCSGLEKIEVAAGNPNYSSQDGILYNKEKTGFIHIPKAIKGAVTIPDSVTWIGWGAFSGCSGLESVTIGSGVTSIGASAFADCSRLTTVYYQGTADEWGNISIGSSNSALTSATRYYFTEDKPTAEEWASYDYWWHYDPETNKPTPWIKEEQ